MHLLVPGGGVMRAVRGIVTVVQLVEMLPFGAYCTIDTATLSWFQADSCEK